MIDLDPADYRGGDYGDDEPTIPASSHRDHLGNWQRAIWNEGDPALVACPKCTGCGIAMHSASYARRGHVINKCNTCEGAGHTVVTVTPNEAIKETPPDLIKWLQVLSGFNTFAYSLLYGGSGFYKRGYLTPAQITAAERMRAGMNAKRSTG